MKIHDETEAAFQDDMRWFADHPSRQLRFRAATSDDALQHESLKDERWVIVPRPLDGLYVRLHGTGELPDGAEDSADAYIEAWLLSHPRERVTYALADPVNLCLFQAGPATAATTDA